MQNRSRRLLGSVAGLASFVVFAACSDDTGGTKRLDGADAQGTGLPIPGGGRRDAQAPLPDAALGFGGSGGSGGSQGGAGGSQGGAGGSQGGSGGSQGGAGGAQGGAGGSQGGGGGAQGGSQGGAGGFGGAPDLDASVPPPPPDARVVPPPPDAAPPPPPDAAPPPVGITPVPCQSGPGSTLFRMHWFGGSHSADIDVWEANCDYSININDACGALPICRGAIGCEVGVTDGGDALALDGGNQYLQVRFTVAGLFFERATVYLEARGMAGNTDFEAWSPIYGGLVLGPVAGGFDYQAGSFDWSELLHPGDDPGLTALRITPVNGSLAIHSVELCLE